MLIIFLRATVIFIVLLFVMRVMGKRQIGEMQPFELVITLLIAELACIPMADISVPLLYGIVSILALFLLHQIISLVEKGGAVTKRLVCGKPSVIIGKEGVDYGEMVKNGLDVDDLLESLRSLGYFSLADVAYAVLESGGKMSALPEKQSDPSNSTPPSLPLVLVADGKVDHNNLKMLKKDLSFLREILLREGTKDVKDVLVFTVDGNGNCYYQEKYRPKKVFSTDLGGVTW